MYNHHYIEDFYPLMIHLSLKENGFSHKGVFALLRDLHSEQMS